jgi:hypothetical protein
MIPAILHNANSLIRGVFLFSALAWVLNQLPGSAAPPEKLTQSITIYDPKADHPWNRLHRALFVRLGFQGEEVGHDEIDPLLWPQTKHLLSGQSHEDVLRALDEFFKHESSAEQVRDPLKRAMLQHDLLSVFDWSSFLYNHQSSETKVDYPAPRRMLQKRLAQAIQRLALSPEAIQALPDNYALATKAKVFRAVFDQDRAGQPFLPPDLFDPEGPWVCVSGSTGIQNGPTAPVHTNFFSGRSVFLVFMRLPGGRQETLAYLDKLNNIPSPWILRNRLPTHKTRMELLNLTPDLPQFPVGTQVALVRQMVLVNGAGELAASRLTESVQLRVYRRIRPDPREPKEAEVRKNQSFFEFNLRRADLIAGKNGGLRLVGDEEQAYLSLQFLTGWSDPFEAPKGEKPRHLMTVMRSCVSCHSDSGIYSVNSYTLPDTTRPRTDLALWPTTLKDEQEKALAWKQKQYDWGLLRGLTDR